MCSIVSSIPRRTDIGSSFRTEHCIVFPDGSNTNASSVSPSSTHSKLSPASSSSSSSLSSTSKRDEKKTNDDTVIPPPKIVVKAVASDVEKTDADKSSR